MDALAAAGHWSLISSRLADWSRRARDAAGRAAARPPPATPALLAARNELRGRFDAYQAKAARRGLAEDPDLAAAGRGGADRRSTPRRVTWTRPGWRVNAYQDALTATSEVLS